MARQAATPRKTAPVKAAVEPRASKSPKAAPIKTSSIKTAATKSGVAGSKAAAAKFDGLSVEQKVAFLLAERDVLLGRIADLEAKQARAADRVAWALDSLRDMLGERA